jgi:hypothetical protein
VERKGKRKKYLLKDLEKFGTDQLKSLHKRDVYRGLNCSPSVAILRFYCYCEPLLYALFNEI